MSRDTPTAAAAAAAAIGSLVAALSCCLPLGPILAALGLAGASAVLEPLRPYLLGVSFVCLGTGFWQAYGRPRCAVRSRASVVILWSTLALLLFVVLLPQTVAGFLADVLPKPEGR